jgi:enediyne biosynthesis protein E4
MAPGPVSASEVCSGDCDGDGAIALAEVVRAVNIALGVAGLESCIGADGDGNGSLAIDELISVVDALVTGCPPSPTASPAVTETPVPTDTPSPTHTPSPSRTPTPSPTNTPSPPDTPSATPTLSATVTVTATASSPPTSTPTPTPTLSPSPTGTPEPTPTTAPPESTPTATDTPSMSWSFVDVTSEAGLAYEHGYLDDFFSAPRLTAAGVAAGDYDGDGWIDLYVVRGSIGPNLLFRNRGDGTFEEVGQSAGVALDGTLGSGPTFADYDGDGHLDLLVLGVGFTDNHDGLATPPTLFRNRGDGTFEDVTAKAGLVVTRDTYSASFADIDRDGDLDLFLTHWGTFPRPGTPAENLWRNNGDGTFTEATLAAGITPYVHPDIGMVDLTFSANFADLDSDGWPDLLLASDFGSSRVFHNDGDGTFTETTSPVISDENGMGSAVGDYDGDGDLDWFVTAVYDPRGVTSPSWGASGNRLYRNRGDGSFEDATDEAGVRQGYWGWGATFADLDNDGDLDLVHVNGWGPAATEETAPFLDDPTRVFLSRGDGTFVESAAALGIDDHGQGRGIVAFDYDGDGDLDLFVANNQQAPRLYRNEGGNRQNFLDVVMHGIPPNTQAIGARLVLTAGGRTQIREIAAGTNFVSQNPAVAHFGLGAAQTVESLRVIWPAGGEAEIHGVAAGQRLVVEQTEKSVGLRKFLTDEPRPN